MPLGEGGSASMQRAILCGAGDLDSAFAHLDHAIDSRDPALVHLAVAPQWDSLRGTFMSTSVWPNEARARTGSLDRGKPFGVSVRALFVSTRTRHPRATPTVFLSGDALRRSLSLEFTQETRIARRHRVTAARRDQDVGHETALNL